jgi:hypothetical protein
VAEGSRSVIARERIGKLSRRALWVPQPGPQLAAMLSPSDQLLYGGAAGGGKTALCIGLALTRHTRTLFIREEAIQLQAVIDEIADVLGSRDGYNGQEKIWRNLPGGRQIQFGGIPNLGDEKKFQGNPRDLFVCDEAANVRESQVRFLLGWNRTTDPRQRCRAVFPSNPPTSADGEWLLRWWAPWLDPKFPRPAAPGELRWVAMLGDDAGGSHEEWVDGPEPFLHKGELITPISRTFIPSRVTDNRFFSDGRYMAVLQAMPEPLRSQMLKGDFLAGRKDDDWQCIPSAWVKAAMDRWKPESDPGAVTSVGVDPSRGGDEATIAARRGWRYDELVSVKADASGVIKGGAIAKRAMDIGGEVAPFHVDVIGVGASAIDHLEAFVGQRAVPVNAAETTEEKDFSGRLGFGNVRAQLWWRFREALSPERPAKVALPPDQRLFADLTAPHYRVTARGIQVEEKDQIKRRLGRSPDRGDAVVLAAMRTPILTDRTGRSGAGRSR